MLTMTPHTQNADVRLVGESNGADCRTIQDAHDDLPDGDEEGRLGSGLIVVDSSYDGSHEEFPIRITKYIDVIGQSRTSSQVVCDDPDVDVFHVIKRTDENTPAKRVRMANLTVEGGRDGVVLDGANYFSASFVTVLGAARDGFAGVRKPGIGGVFGGYFERCYVRYCGRHGFSFPPPTNAHGFALHRCSGTENGGFGALLNGFGIGIFGGAYQINGDAGVVLEGGGEMGTGAVGLHNTYVEYNGSVQTHPRDVVLGDEVRGATLHNCYITGAREFDDAETHAAVESRDNADCRIDHCTFRGYGWCEEAGLFDISDDTSRLDLNLGSHHRFHGADETNTFLRRPAQFYSNGVRHGNDPLSEAGRYDGEFAYADGRLWVWSADDGTWNGCGESETRRPGA